MLPPSILVAAVVFLLTALVCGRGLPTIASVAVFSPSSLSITAASFGELPHVPHPPPHLHASKGPAAPAPLAATAVVAALVGVLAKPGIYAGAEHDVEESIANGDVRAPARRAGRWSVSSCGIGILCRVLLWPVRVQWPLRHCRQHQQGRAVSIPALRRRLTLQTVKQPLLEAISMGVRPSLCALVMSAAAPMSYSHRHTDRWPFAGDPHGSDAVVVRLGMSAAALIFPNSHWHTDRWPLQAACASEAAVVRLADVRRRAPRRANFMMMSLPCRR